jgi:hypothetical protein
MVLARGIEQFSDYLNRKNIYKAYERNVILLTSLLLSISLLITIGLLQYEVYDSYFKQRYDYMIETSYLCYYINLTDIDCVMTPLSLLLIITFIFIYQRRSCCLNRCSWKNIGVPMITSLWNKTDRANTAVVYARIAFEVFRLFQNLFQGNSNNTGKKMHIFIDLKKS